MSRYKTWLSSFYLLALILIGLVSPVISNAQVALKDALDNPTQGDGTPLEFITSSSTGTGNWFVSSVTPTSGDSYSAQSGAISPGQFSRIETSVTGIASLSFYQRVSSEPANDGLSFYDGTKLVSKISGSLNWVQKSYLVSGGTHTLKWEYKKNATITKGSDAAWINKVVLSPNLAVKVVAPNGGEVLAAGSSVDITWNAPAAAEKYSLFYSLNNGGTWLPISGADTITSVNLSGITYSWAVPVPTANKPACKVKVIAYNAANVVVGTDISDQPFTIQVLNVVSPNGGEVINPKDNPATISYEIFGQAEATSALFSYTINGGVTWLPIGTASGSLDAGVHTYEWNAPASTTIKSNCKVKVVLKNASGTVIGTDMSDVKFTILPGYSISGIVTLNGKALSGVTMNLTGGETGTTTTDALGKYSFKSLLKGNYTVSAAKNGYVFKPASSLVAINTANITTTNFAAITSVSPTYTISGTVSGATGTAVTLTLSGTVSGTAMTDGLGDYSFTNLPAGSYSVTPSKAGHLFDPMAQGSVVTANWTGVNFISSASAATTYSISGKVTSKAIGLPGVLIEVSGAANASVVTDSLGNYTVKGLRNDNYTLSPSLEGYTFAPVSVNRTVTANLAGINFVASGTGPTYSITGQVLLVNTVTPVSGVTIAINTAPVRTTTTDGAGNYSLANLPNGSYTVTPSKASCVFTPANTLVIVSGAARTANFRATTTVAGVIPLLTAKVVGEGNWEGLHGASVQGATVVLGDSTGAMISSKLTDSNGEATFVDAARGATVTVVYSCLESGATTTTYTLDARYDVNAATAIFSVDDCSQPDTISVDVTNLPVEATYVQATFAGCSGCNSSNIGNINNGSQTMNISIYPGDYQDDGTFSLVTIATDSSNTPITYGLLADQTIVSGTTFTISSNQTFTTFAQHQLFNLPASAKYAFVVSGPVRNGQMIPIFTNISPLAATVTATVPVIPDFGTTYWSEAYISMDTDNDGIRDAQQWSNYGALTATDTSTDFSQMPAIPSNLSVSGSSIGRPSFSWEGIDPTSHALFGNLNLITSADSSLNFNFTASPSRTMIAFPELPASMASLKPIGAHYSDAGIVNMVSDIYAGYDDYQAKEAQFYNGTWNMPTTYTSKGSGAFFSAAPVSMGTWTTAVIDSGGDVGVGVSVAMDKNNKAHVSYYDITNKAIKYATNASGSWMTETVDTNIDGGGSPSHSVIKVDSNNKAHICYVTTSSGVKYATNKSGAWVASSAAANAHSFAMDMDATDKLYLAYSSGSKVVCATNSTGAWVETTADPNTSGSNIAMAIDKNGKLHLMYVATGLRYANNVSGSWSSSLVDSASSTYNGMAMAVDTNCKVHATYGEFPTSWQLKYITNASSSWIVSGIGEKSDNYSYTSIITDTNNKVHIAALGGYPRAHYTTNISGWWESYGVDDAQWGISLSLDSNSKAHIAYYADPMSGPVKYATNRN